MFWDVQNYPPSSTISTPPKKYGFKDMPERIVEDLKLVKPDIEIIYNTRLTLQNLASPDQAFAFFSSPTQIGPVTDVDVIVNCTGVRVDSSIFSAEFPKDDKGYLKTTPTFNVPGFKNVFVIGDITDRKIKLAYLVPQVSEGCCGDR